MEYSRLGNTGLLVSRLAFGNMVNYAPEDEETNVEIIKTLYEAGVNFFDSAEAYDILLIKILKWFVRRVTWKINLLMLLPPSYSFVPTLIVIINFSLGKLITLRTNEQEGGNNINRLITLNRKHIIECVDASLKRMQLEYADIVFAHFYDYDTQIDEVCRGFNEVIEQGKAFYWATSNWTAAQIQSAINYCQQNNLIKPVAEQCIYNMLSREQVEKDLVNLFDQQNYGTTTWSPLHGGLLTGKYNKQIPEGSRAAINEFFKTFFFTIHTSNDDTMNKLRQLEELAQSLGYTQTQLSIAWVLQNKNVSTAIFGGRTVAQVKDSLKALELYKKWDKNLEEKVENILKNKPKQEMDFRKYSQFPDRRQ